MCIEINTSGLRKEKEGLRKEIYPDPLILQWAKEMDIPITIGSDAHRAEDVGACFRGYVQEVLRKVGYTHANYFVQRKRVEYPVDLA